MGVTIVDVSVESVSDVGIDFDLHGRARVWVFHNHNPNREQQAIKTYENKTTKCQ